MYHVQTITGLFFLAIAYTDGVSIVALALLYFVLILMFLMFVSLANFKGRQVTAHAHSAEPCRVWRLLCCCVLTMSTQCLQFVYIQLLERKVVSDLTASDYKKNWKTWAIGAGAFTAWPWWCLKTRASWSRRGL